MSTNHYQPKKLNSSLVYIAYFSILPQWCEFVLSTSYGSTTELKSFPLEPRIIWLSNGSKWFDGPSAHLASLLHLHCL